MDANGEIYASPSPPAEDVARLDGYLRGLEAHDPDTAEKLADLQRQFDLVQSGAEADRIRADLNERLRVDAQNDLLAALEDLGRKS